MFHWICPECGREIPPKLKECPSCDPQSVTVEQAVAPTEPIALSVVPPPLPSAMSAPPEPVATPVVPQVPESVESAPVAVETAKPTETVKAVEPEIAPEPIEPAKAADVAKVAEPVPVSETVEPPALIEAAKAVEPEPVAEIVARPTPIKAPKTARTKSVPQTAPPTPSEAAKAPELPAPLETIKATQPEPVPETVEPAVPIEAFKGAEPERPDTVEAPAPIEAIKAAEPEPVPETVEPPVTIEAIKTAEPEPVPETVEAPAPIEAVKATETVEPPVPIEVSKAAEPEPLQAIAPVEETKKPQPEAVQLAAEPPAIVEAKTVEPAEPAPLAPTAEAAPQQPEPAASVEPHPIEQVEPVAHPEPVAATQPDPAGAEQPPSVPAAVAIPEPVVETVAESTHAGFDPLLALVEQIRDAQSVAVNEDAHSVAAKQDAHSVAANEGAQSVVRQEPEAAPEPIAIPSPVEAAVEATPATPEPEAPAEPAPDLAGLATAVGLNSPIQQHVEQPVAQQEQPRTEQPIEQSAEAPAPPAVAETAAPSRDLDETQEMRIPTGAAYAQAAELALFNPPTQLALLAPPEPAASPAEPAPEPEPLSPERRAVADIAAAEEPVGDKAPSGSWLQLAPLQDYSAAATRAMQPAPPSGKILTPDSGPRITLPGPTLPPELARFQDANLATVLNEGPRSRKIRLKGFGISVGVMLLLGLMGAAVVVYFFPAHSNAETKPPVSEIQASATQPASHPLAQYIEVTGFRIIVDYNKKSEIHYLIVNHSAADLSDVTVFVTLRSGSAKPGQPPLCRFSFRTPGLGPFESKEMTSSIEKLSRSITLPEWQDLRSDIQVAQ
jgi:hypothetical protein